MRIFCWKCAQERELPEGAVYCSFCGFELCAETKSISHQADDEGSAAQKKEESPPPLFPIRVNCPHCHNAIALVDRERDGDVECPSCQESFRLDPDETPSWSEEKLTPIGKYHLLRQIGRGAFGTVYVARDTELDRLVAVKVPRSGTFATRADEDRFIRESRSVAQLNHRHIVQVFDTGHTGEFPYMVSEFVPGATLTEILKNRRFTSREAAELLATLAEAIHYAHLHRIIHRDLKPGNIMMDDDGQPRIMDFGLAKRDQADITMTVDGKILGTPAYMSPEQARGDGNLADAKSDVYSLGVILFELLTGERPFRGNNTTLLYAVINIEPPSPRTLDLRISRDLETIGLKCLQKDPSRRYASARELAEDLLRYLRNEPILARPVGIWERGWRWCQRNRAVAGAAAAVFTTLVVALAVVSLSWRAERAAQAAATTLAKANQKLFEDERAARVATDRSRQESLRRFREARQAVDLSLTEFSDALRLFPGVSEARQRVLFKAAENYERFALEYSDDPELELERIRVLLRLAVIKRDLHRYDESEAILQNAIGSLDKSMATRPATDDMRLESGKARTQLALLRTAQGLPKDAEREFSLALEHLQPLLDRSTPNLQVLDGLATVLVDRAILSTQIGQLEQASVAASEAMRRFDELMKRAPDEKRYQVGRATAQDVLGQTLALRGRHEEGAHQLGEAISSWNALVKADPDNTDYLQTRAEAQVRLARTRRDQGRHRDAQRALEQATADFELVDRTRPDIPAFQDNVVVALIDLGLLNAEQGRTSEARKLLEQADKIVGDLAAKYPFEAEYLAHQAACWQALGNVLSDLDENMAAKELLERASRQYHQVATAVPSVLDYQERAAIAAAHLGWLLQKLGESEAARERLDTALEGLTRLTQDVEESPAYCDEAAHTHLRVASLHWAAQRDEDARRHIQRTRELWDRATAGDHPAAEFLSSYARFLVECESVEFRDAPRAVSLAKRAMLASPQNAFYVSLLGHAYVRAGQCESALQTLDQAQSLHQELNARDGFFRSIAMAKQGQTVAAQQTWQQADAWMQKRQPGNVDLQRLRKEAAESAGIEMSTVPINGRP